MLELENKKGISLVICFLPSEVNLLTQLLNQISNLRIPIQLILSGIESYQDFVNNASDECVIALNAILMGELRGFKYVAGSPGRARQMNRAANFAKEEVLWFLHVDSRFSDSSLIYLNNTFQELSFSKTAFYFHLNFYDGPSYLKINSFLTRYRSQFLGMIYGDQGLMIQKDHFESIGLYRENLSYGEDHDLVWRARLCGLHWSSVGEIESSGRAYSKRWLKLSLKRIYLGYAQAVLYWLKMFRSLFFTKEWEQEAKAKMFQKTSEHSASGNFMGSSLHPDTLNQRSDKTIAVAVFVKTPGHSSLKTRLAGSIGSLRAENFHLVACKKIEGELLTLKEKLKIQSYWAVSEESALDCKLWSSLPKLTQGEGGLGLKLHKIYSELKRKYDVVFLVGADCLDLSAEDFMKSVDLLEGNADFCLGLAEDGGYYIFAGQKNISQEIWDSVPYSQENTAKIFSEKLIALGNLSSELPVRYDVDTVAEYMRVTF